MRADEIAGSAGSRCGRNRRTFTSATSRSALETVGLLARVKWPLGVVAILALGQAQPVKCERQTSDFGGDFAGFDSDFGVNSIDCRA
jgi:hypothetical protein